MFRVMRTKNYSQIQMQNMARNLGIKYRYSNEGIYSIDLDRTVHYSMKNPQKSTGTIFTLKIGYHKTFTFSTWKGLQTKYFKIIKEEE